MMYATLYLLGGIASAELTFWKMRRECERMKHPATNYLAVVLIWPVPIVIGTWIGLRKAWRER